MFRLIPGPREGWLFLFLLGAVVLSPALSLAEAAWVEDLSIIPWLAFFSLLLGSVLAKLRVRWLVAHLFALEVGIALICTYFAATPRRGDGEQRLLWLWGRIWAWLEAAFTGGMSNDPMLFALLMALLAWTLGYFSAWLAFRSHNVWPPLLACGSALLVNLSYGPPNGLFHFLLFLLASMLLLVRVTLVQKERDWNRVEAEYNRGLSWSSLLGSVALSVAIVAAAWTLPTGTVNASVAESWFRLTEPWQKVQVEFDRLFAAVGTPSAKLEGNRFSKTLALKGAIELGPEPVLVVSSPRAEYWATQAYDRYTGQGWISSAGETTRLEPNDPRLAETSLYRGREDVEQRFKLLGPRTGSLFAATSPVKLSLPVNADHFGDLEELAALRPIVPLRQGQQYAVVSSVSVASATQLSKAGTGYPEWTARYVELPTDARSRFGPLSRVVTTSRRVVQEAGNPYDAAVALQQYLRGFRYETKVSAPPPDRDAVDWFLFVSKEGYCDYFASAMAVMARAAGIPARVVSGYNTGVYDEQTALYEVKQENAHSWPELFFPEYGWVRFEPTPSQPAPERPETGPEETVAESSLSEDELAALGLETTGRDKMLLDDDFGSMQGSAAFGAEDVLRGTIEGSRLAALFALAGAALLWLGGTFVLARLSVSRRRYLQLYWVAGLLGLRLRPSHTPGEYARVLGEASGDLRPEVETVVRSYMEETYGGRRPGDEAGVERSWRRLRLRLPLRLLEAAVNRRRSSE